MIILIRSLALVIISTAASAQVGINNPSPQQTLDVKGKIALSDDRTPPTAGTLRYNASEEAFEGYNGAKWSRLTNIPQTAGSGSLPEGAIPVYGVTNGITADGEVENFPINYGDGSVSTDVVPENTYLLVTWINVRDNDINPTETTRVLAIVAPRTSASAFPTVSRGLYMSGTLPDMIWTQSSLSPLIICRPGERLAASNSQSSEDFINVEFRGFLVPDLDY